MMRMHERIPQEMFDATFRPMVRELGSRNVILRLNNEARTAIPRQTKLAQLMPKLEILVYQQKRPKVDEELEQLWNIYFEDRLDEELDEFEELSHTLNDKLDQGKVPEDESSREEVAGAIGAIVEFLKQREFENGEIEAAFRIKAFPEVLKLYIERFRGE